MQRLARCARPSIAVGAAAAATCAATLLGTASSDAEAMAEPPPFLDGQRPIARHYSRRDSAASSSLVRSNATQFANPSILLASSPMSGTTSGTQDVSTDASEENGASTAREGSRIECDYVIIGHGKAGRSAVRTITQLDPSAHIVIIDPNHSTQESIQRSGTAKRRGMLLSRMSEGSVQHLPTRAGYIDHSKRLIHIHPFAQNHRGEENDNRTSAVHYRKSALIATGSRGAPPPESCIRPDAYSRILELRSTALPPTIQMPRIANGDGKLQSSPIPVLDPPTVRSLSIMAASQGATVAVMGSGFDALELAAACARAAPNRNENGAKNDESKVLLLFGNSSPMSNRLPRYLGAAVTKRLRQFGIGVEDRALTRYISMETMGTSKKDAQPPRLEVYAVKSYDHLDSTRVNADLLVLAPSVNGLNGTAVVPVPMPTPSHSTEHLPWSSLVSPPLLTCYLDDGRIATNSQFNAASSLYAAGSVARYPNARTGRAEVAGGRHVSTEQAGAAAARSMVRDIGNISTEHCSMQQSIPVWRSDVVSYLPNDDNADTEEQRTNRSAATQALYSMGIHALCVGRCDSESMATHGFWWTNTNQSGESKQNGNGSKTNSAKTIGPNAFMRRATRKANVSGSKSGGRGSLPVYGSGVVFYLGRSGDIEGIMLWGLPFSEDPKDVRSNINTNMVERMKVMIRSNGGIAIREHSAKILEENPGTNLDVGLLSYLHLAEESKRLASMALSGLPSDGNEIERGNVSIRGRPLHRFTPTKPLELTNLGKIARRDESGLLAEEDDLFCSTKTSSQDRVDEAARPPSLKRVYPMSGGGAALVGTEEHELEREIERRRLRIERSRPPKEEPLWLRQGEEQRYQNRRDVWADSFLRNIQAGRFSDGSDSVKQAPVPKAYLDAKETWKLWTGGDNGDDDVDG